MIQGPTVADEMRKCRLSAVHVEMRDAYTLKDPMLQAWRLGHREIPGDPSPEWKPWLDLVAETTRRGVQVLRARIISEPLSEYIRYEYDLTHMNIAFGERVRWLPRRMATAIALPGNDFWLFDNEVLLINHFDGNGNATAKELVDDAGAVALCASAFAAVWERAIPHESYRPA